MKNIFSTLILSACLISITACADNANSANKDKAADAQQIKTNIETSMRTTVSNIEAIEDSGLYEVIIDGNIAYATNSGKHIILDGSVYRLDKPAGLTDITQERASQRFVEKFSSMDSSQLITFKANNEKYAIYVFTDTSCGYCRKLHHDVPELNKKGITVNYLAFPRSGPNSATGNELRNIWCSDNQQDAMTAGKNGQAVAEAPATCQAPIEEQYLLGVELGVRGTPAVFTAQGQQIGGYLAPHAMLRKLEL